MNRDRLWQNYIDKFEIYLKIEISDNSKYRDLYKFVFQNMVFVSFLLHKNGKTSQSTKLHVTSVRYLFFTEVIQHVYFQKSRNLSCFHSIRGFRISMTKFKPFHVLGNDILKNIQKVCDFHMARLFRKSFLLCLPVTEESF